MRPRSITGPVVLVIVGVLILLSNLGYSIPFWRYLADYWPFLLIGLGVVRLAEVLFHVSRGSAPPHGSGGSGFFWVVLILVCLAVWGNRNGFYVRSFNTPGTIGIFGSPFDYDVSAKGSTDGITRLVIDNIGGDLTVHGSDGSEVQVTGHKTVRAFSRNEADRADKDSTVQLLRQTQGDSLLLRAGEPARMGLRSISTDLDIAVPRGMNVEVRGRGDLNIQDMAGMVNVTDSRGDIVLSNIGKDLRVVAHGGLIRATGVKGSIDLQGRGGDVQLENVDGPVTVDGEFSGTLEFRALAMPLHFQSSHSDFRAEKVPGSITMDLGDLKLDNVVGPVSFRTGTRDIDATDITNSLELNVDRGDIEVSASKLALPKMDVHSHNGDIALTLPENAGFSLDGKAGTGEVENGFGSALETHNDGRSARIQGRVGNGPQLLAVTDRGTLTIRKK